MKRRRINLLSLTLKKFNFDTAAKKVQNYLIGALVVLLFVVGVLFFFNNYLTQQLEEVEKSKKPLVQYFQSNEDFDKKIKLFIYKNNLLKEYIKQDADAYTYYNNLLTHINGVSPEAQVKNFAVDNTKQTEFELIFPSYDTAQIFLNALETPDFIKPFEYLKLTGFALSNKEDNTFSLRLEGKFLEK